MEGILKKGRGLGSLVVVWGTQGGIQGVVMYNSDREVRRHFLGLISAILRVFLGLEILQ